MFAIAAVAGTGETIGPGGLLGQRDQGDQGGPDGPDGPCQQKYGTVLYRTVWHCSGLGLVWPGTWPCLATWTIVEYRRSGELVCACVLYMVCVRAFVPLCDHLLLETRDASDVVFWKADWKRILAHERQPSRHESMPMGDG